MENFLILMVIIYFYLMPSAIAVQKQSQMTGAIFFLNLFLWKALEKYNEKPSYSTTNGDLLKSLYTLLAII